MYLNKSFILGNLTRDPELRTMPSGRPVVSFSIATNRAWKDQEGNKQEAAEFHNVVVFGRQGELCAQYLKKGQSVLVEGRLQTRSWDGTDGQKRYRTEIVADRVQFGPKSSNINTGGAYSQTGGSASATQKKENPPDEMPTIEYPEEEIKAEDIPF